MSREAGRDEFPLGATHQELASRLGTVREVISRNLMRFRADGLDVRPRCLLVVGGKQEDVRKTVQAVLALLCAVFERPTTQEAANLDVISSDLRQFSRSLCGATRVCSSQPFGCPFPDQSGCMPVTASTFRTRTTLSGAKQNLKHSAVGTFSSFAGDAPWAGTYGHSECPRTIGRSSSTNWLQRFDRSVLPHISKLKPVTERKSGVGLRSFT